MLSTIGALDVEYAKYAEYNRSGFAAFLEK